jgi:Putative zincin peptidase
MGGGTPRLGASVRWGLPLVYVGFPGQRVSRARFLLVALAPLAVLDLAGLALMLSAGTAPFGGTMVVVVNTGGAVGDIWTTRFRI